MKNNQKSEKGQGIVEFALIFPFVFFLVLLFFEATWFLYNYTAIASASREAARYGAGVGVNADGIPQYQDCEGMLEIIHRHTLLLSIEDSDIQLSYDKGPATSDIGTCPNLQANLGDRIKVSVRTNYQPLINFDFMPTLPIQSESNRTIITDIVLE